MMGQHVSRHRAGQRLRADGISLYTMLAAVVVLGLLGASVASQYDGSNTKSEALMTRMRLVGQAAVRFRDDTGCYPSTAAVLVDFTSNPNANGCGAVLSDDLWYGPYVTTPTAGRNIALDGMGAQAELAMDTTARDTGTHNVYTVRVAPSLVQASYDQCGGTTGPCRLISVDGQQQLVYTYER